MASKKKPVKLVEPENKLSPLPAPEISEDLARHLSLFPEPDSKVRVLAKSKAARKKRETIKVILAAKDKKQTKEATEMERARAELAREKANTRKRLSALNEAQKISKES